MTDVSYSIGCTFAEIFIRVIVQKYNLVYIVRVRAGVQNTALHEQS